MKKSVVRQEKEELSNIWLCNMQYRRQVGGKGVTTPGPGLRGGPGKMKVTRVA